MSDELRIALVQMTVTDGDAEANWRRAAGMIRNAPPADVYLVPELFTTGYAHDRWATSAAQDTPRIATALRDLARERSATIGASMISSVPTGLANRFWLFPPDGGTPVTYDKAHLFAPMAEDRHLVAGDRRVRAAVGPWNAALSICFDLRFPEMYRLDAVQGADLFLVVAEWPAERAAILRALAIARAIENQAYLALVNRVGRAATDGTAFGGGSMLVGPDGSIVVDAGTSEGVVVGVAERAAPARARSALPVLPLRRPGLDF